MFSRCRDWIVKKRKKGSLCRWSRCVPSEQASSEFIGMAPIAEVPPEERRQSLPRRLLGRFLSESSINDEAEVLKQLMIDHGLYHRHQTLQQRRRVKELLELEHRSLQADAERQRDDFLLQHSLLYGAAPYGWTRLNSEIAPLYRDYLIRANSTQKYNLSSLPVLPQARFCASHTTRSKSEPAILQKPYVAPFQPGRQTMQPLSSLPYLETAV